ncbi:hypothetical protein DFJ73DRAFT_960474 [Zopfochytrium polystomum]|nr:hypothetical protein DFJ73DRAFT_960474 [Zopfochytrium polystomum]
MVMSRDANSAKEHLVLDTAFETDVEKRSEALRDVWEDCRAKRNRALRELIPKLRSSLEPIRDVCLSKRTKGVIVNDFEEAVKSANKRIDKWLEDDDKKHGKWRQKHLSMEKSANKIWNVGSELPDLRKESPIFFEILEIVEILALQVLGIIQTPPDPNALTHFLLEILPKTSKCNVYFSRLHGFRAMSQSNKVLKMLIQKHPKNANLFRKIASQVASSQKDKQAKATATKKGTKSAKATTPKKGLTKPTKQAKMTVAKSAKATTPKKGLAKPTKQAKMTVAKKGTTPLKTRVVAGRVKGGKK